MKIIFICLSILFGIAPNLRSQNSLVFNYDAAGNLTQRNVIVVPPQPQPRMAQPTSKGTENKKDSSSVVSFSVFPNPTKEFLNIEGTLPEQSASAKLYLFNNNGQKMLEDVYEGKQKQIALSNLPAGLYYLEVKCSTKNSASYKIVITN
jgi:hypothetical protein